MVTGKELVLEISQLVYEEDLDKTENMEGLNLVNFYFSRILILKISKKSGKDFIGKEVAKGMSEKIYALDDDSALKLLMEKLKWQARGSGLLI